MTRYQANKVLKGIGLKQCSKCKEVKALADYYPNYYKACKQSHEPSCKECRRKTTIESKMKRNGVKLF